MKIRINKEHIIQIKYDDKLISTQEYYEWCYENGYIEFCNITQEEKLQLSKDFIKKIEELYDYSEDNYY